MPNSLLLSVTVLLVLVASPGNALKCYKCWGRDGACSKSKLEANKAYYEITCKPEEVACIRVWQNIDHSAEGWGGKWVFNFCGTQERCDDEKSSCKTHKCKKVRKVACCSTDFCNTGSPVTLSSFLLTVSSVLGLALWCVLK